MAIRSTVLIKSPLLLAALLLMHGCASAPGQSSGPEGAFIRAAATWDLNRDGIVTCDEWRSYALQLFREADVNKDGKLTPEEFASITNKDRLFEVADFKYFDAGAKGFVTQADFADRPNPAFLFIDKEKTCKLQAYQLRAAVSGAELKPERSWEDITKGGR